MNSHPRVIAVLEKKLAKPISQLVRLGLENRALTDVVDAQLGIYGRRYGVANGGLTYKLKEGQPAVARALMELKG